MREVEPLRADGSGVVPRVVLVHGAMDRRASFRRIERALPTATVVSYDRRGYGDSMNVAPSGDLDDHVTDLEAVVGGSATVLFGHSLGGALVLTLAGRRPDLVPAAAVFEPPFPWLSWWPESNTLRTAAESGPAAAAESFLRRFLGERIWGRLPEAHRAERRLEGPALLADMKALRGAPPFAVASLTGPLVIGQGEHSLAMYGRGIAEFCGLLPPGARYESVVVPGARHGAHLSHPIELSALIQRAADMIGA